MFSADVPSREEKPIRLRVWALLYASEKTEGENTDGLITDGENTDGENTDGLNTDGENLFSEPKTGEATPLFYAFIAGQQRYLPAIMAILVAGWHLPLFFMPVFELPLIGFVTTLAVTFWYAWLLNHASGSSLITLIAHGTEGSVETNDLWGPGADLVRLNYVYAAAWSVVAIGLVVLHHRFWTRSDPAKRSAHADMPMPAATAAGRR